jgi:hypothetical protein
LDKYTALDDKGQRFIDNVIAFFKPVIQQELNQPTSAHDFAYAESLDQELQLREATLMYQYMVTLFYVCFKRMFSNSNYIKFIEY